jgi:hypothetical protein
MASTLSIDPSSNLVPVISKFPDHYRFSGVLYFNPYDPGRYSYIREQDSIVVNVEGDIPMNFSLSQVNLRKDFPLNLSKLSKLADSIAVIKLQVKVENQFPIELSVQSYFNDKTQTVFDSLFAAPMQIKPSILPGVPYVSVFLIDKNKDQIRKLRDCVSMTTKLSFSTPGSTSGLVNFDVSNSLKMEIIGFTRINL